MPLTHSHAFEDLAVGQTASSTRRVSDGDVRAFAALSGDTNPIHLDEAYARGTRFGGRIVHGMLVAAHISTALATRLPGPGTIFLSQTLRFERPVRVGDELTTELEVTALRPDRKFVTLACRVRNAAGEVVVSGEALVLPPRESATIELAEAPPLELHGALPPESVGA